MGVTATRCCVHRYAAFVPLPTYTRCVVIRIILGSNRSLTDTMVSI